MRRFPLRAANISAVLIAAVMLGGCTQTWTGKGKDVAKAIEQSSKVKTARYSASIEVGVTGIPGQPAGSEEFAMTMSGKSDVNDPAKPKMEMSMNAAGQSVKVVEPGDGRTYMTTSGKSYSFPSTDPTQQKTESARILAALGSSVGGFKEAQPITNLQGESVPSIYAKVDKGKLCSTVVGAFNETLESSGGTSDLSATLGAGMAGGMADLCKQMVKEDPGVWFGIRDGMLTDLAMTANLVLPLGAAVSMTVQYHEYDQDQDVGEFNAPANATAVGSIAEAQGVITGAR